MSKYDSMLGKQFGDYIMDSCVGIDRTGHKLYSFKCPVCGDEFVTTPYEVISGRHKTICNHQGANTTTTSSTLTSGYVSIIDKDDNFPPCNAVVESTMQINDYLTISELNQDFFDVGFNYYLAHVVPYSLRLRGSSIARQINKYFDMETRLKLVAEDNDCEVGDVLEVANVYNMILGYRDDSGKYHRPSLDDIRSAIRTVAECCRIDHVPFLAMPKICTGKLGYKWNEIKDIIIEEFSEVYDEENEDFDDGYETTPLSVEICFQ